MACKPGSVPAIAGDGHSSGTPVTGRLARPTRMTMRKRIRPHARRRGPAIPIWSCSRWGLPCRRRYRKRGALLPHHFTLAAPPEDRVWRYVSVALSLGSPPPAVSRHRVSVEPGLSSPRPRGRRAAIRPSGAPYLSLSNGGCQDRDPVPCLVIRHAVTSRRPEMALKGGEHLPGAKIERAGDR